MVDVRGQYARIQSDIDQAVLKVIRSGQYINGPAVRDFTSALADWLGHTAEHPVHVVPCANGTDALQAALMALDLKPGDEVITPSFTFISTVEVIHLLRLTPVMVDVDPCTFTLDPASVAKAVTPRTKAIMPVHLYGQCADMTSSGPSPTNTVCRSSKDTAQAIGSAWEETAPANGGLPEPWAPSAPRASSRPRIWGPTGTAGRASPEMPNSAERLRMICNHGSRQRYQHELIGMNSRLDSIQAAILNVKLPHLDGTTMPPGAEPPRTAMMPCWPSPAGVTPYRHPQSRHVFHQYTLKLNNKGEGPGSGIMWPPTCKPRACLLGLLSQAHSPAGCLFRRASATGDLPVTEDLTDRVLGLPMHTELTEPQQRSWCVDAILGGSIRIFDSPCIPLLS